MDYKKIVISFVCAGLIVAYTQQWSIHAIQFHQHISDVLEYEINVPTGFSYQTPDEDGMYFGYPETSHLGHFYIQIYENLPPHSPCTPNELKYRINIPNPVVEEKEGDEVVRVWGKAGHYPWKDMPVGVEYPYCQPGFGYDDNWEFYDIEYGYTFCAKQDDRTVVICMIQQQDDPELAQQIFESFRWTSPSSTPPPASAMADYDEHGEMTLKQEPSTPLKFGVILSTVILVGIGVFLRLR